MKDRNKTLSNIQRVLTMLEKAVDRLSRQKFLLVLLQIVWVGRLNCWPKFTEQTLHKPKIRSCFSP